MFSFDARTVAPQTALEPVPVNWYKVVITKSNVKPTKNDVNQAYLELVMTIIEGQFKDRQLYVNLNIFNQSQQAVEIAYKQLSAICHVVGQYNVQAQQNAPDNTTPMLHNIPFMAYVVVGTGTNGPNNNVKGFKDIAGNDPGKQGQNQGGTQQPQGGQPGPGFGAQPQPGQGQPGATWNGPQGGTAPGGQYPNGAPQGGQPQQQPQYANPNPNPQQPNNAGWSTGPAPQGQPVQTPQFQPPPPNQQQPQAQPQYAPPGGQQPQGQPQYQQPQPGTFQPGNAPQGGPAGAAPWSR